MNAIIETMVNWLTDAGHLSILITVIFGVTGVFFPLRNYIKERRTQIRLVYRKFDNGSKDLTLKKKSSFKNLIIQGNELQRSNDGDGFINWINPHLKNKSNNPITGFDLKVRIVTTGELKPETIEFHPDYEIEKRDTFAIDLKYKKDYVRAKSFIPNPINFISTPIDNPLENSIFDFQLWYTIRYNGITKERDFSIDNTISFDVFNDESFLKKQIKSYYSDCYRKIGFLYIKKRRKQLCSMVSIYGTFDTKIIEPSLIITRSKFEKNQMKYVENTKTIKRVYYDNFLLA